MFSWLYTSKKKDIKSILKKIWVYDLDTWKKESIAINHDAVRFSF